MVNNTKSTTTSAQPLSASADNSRRIVPDSLVAGVYTAVRSFGAATNVPAPSGVVQMKFDAWATAAPVVV